MHAWNSWENYWVDTCALLLCEAKVHSSSVSKVYVVRLPIVFLKAALQKRGSVEPMESPLDPPLCNCAGRRFSKVRHVWQFSKLSDVKTASGSLEMSTNSVQQMSNSRSVLASLAIIYSLPLSLTHPQCFTYLLQSNNAYFFPCVYHCRTRGH